MKVTLLFCAVIFLVYNFNNGVRGAKILGAVFTPSYSHQTAFWPIWKELSLRGHQVTVLTTDPMNDKSLKNLTEIDLSQSYKIINNVTTFISVNSAKISYFKLIDIYCSALNEIADEQLNHTEVKQLIAGKKGSFDILLVETVFPTQLAFAKHFNIPFIGLTSLDAPPRVHESLGNPINPALYPDFILPYVPPLSFRERLISLITWLVMKFYSSYVLYPRADEVVKKHFGNDLPPLSEIEKDMSMLFTNVNPIFHGVRPLGPSTIQIGGGVHIKEEKPLPKDIKEYLDSASNGLIYLSFGTNIKSKDINDKTRNIILNIFKELPYKILWKFENEHMPNKPDNVKILKWVPQQDLLRHPKVKLFITQCGLQSMEEAIFNHVPMIGIPFFGDQVNNAKILERKGFGVQIDSKSITEELFKEAIIEVITNTKYRNSLKQAADLVSDVELTGLEKAVFWTEYTIRHKGAKFLKSPAVDIPFYKYYLLDVILFLLLAISISVYVMKLCLCFVLRKIMKRKHKKE